MDEQKTKDLRQRLVDAFQQIVKANDHDRLEAFEKLKQWYLQTGQADQVFHKIFSDLTQGFHKLHELLPKEDFQTLTGAYRKRDYINVLKILEAMNPGQMILTDLEMGADAAYATQNESLVHLYTDRILARQPAHFRALLLKGGNFYRQKNYNEAKIYFQKILDLQPQNKIALEYLERLQKYSFNQTTPMGAARRRWRRLPVNHSMTCNSYEKMYAQEVRVKSLSAGGCLIEADELPSEFNFSLVLDRNSQVQGYAKVIYQKGNRHWGVRFMEISPRDEDAINNSLVASS
jgi:tetratricopeptide (TPR) repeat protein